MFAVAYVSAGRVELHDSTGRFIGLATVPDSSDGDFEAVAGGQLRWNSQRYYYSGCAVTDQYLFLLYSGEAESADPGGFAGSSTVQVLGWDGRFIGEFLLSVPLMRFTIDAAGDRMLGSGVEDGTIYTFDIPDRFRTLP